MIEYESSIVPLFGKALYSKVTNINTKEILNIVDDIVDWVPTDESLDADTENISMSSTSNNILEDDRLTFLKNELLNEFHLFSKNEMKDVNDFQITTSWLTKTFKGQSSNLHNHHHSFYSGLLYLQTSDDGAEIVFKNMDSNNKGLEVSEFNVYNSRTWKVKPKDALVLFFPSELYHKIAKSNSDVIRRSLAFNLMPTGALGNPNSDSTVTVDRW